MKKVDFDAYAADYEEHLGHNMAAFGKDTAYYAEYKIRLFARLWDRSTPPARVLEYGVGTGRNLPYLRAQFPGSTIGGCDISAKSVAIAQQVVPDGEFFVLGKPEAKRRKPYDAIFVAGVFHHIAPGLRAGAIEQLKALLAPGGQVVIFEHNPLNPVTRRLVRTCAFDSDAILLPPRELIERLETRGLTVTHRQSTLFFPAALKVLAPLERFLGWLPLGGQYVVRAVKAQ
ncbi:class I SAM-dependent methyltransferase [Candidatus Berkelbacteria bacterium]|nr:class I SAM-dependent methyltransferase [Candidatus Berkelbacteria bacterium]